MVQKKLTLFDPVGACRITRLLANIQRILDEHGRQQAPKSHSSVRVDEDFWYMRVGISCAQMSSMKDGRILRYSTHDQKMPYP